jgi:acyl-CoA thioester hydrolase
MGVAYYANYLVWFEVGRTELLKACGFTYSEMEKNGIFLPVMEAYVNYLKPARYEDKLNIYSEVSEVSRAKIKITCQVKRGEEILATGFTVHPFINGRWQAIRAPQELVDKISKGSIK